MKNKIAFVTPNYDPSLLTGSGVVVRQLATEFAARGYDVSVITSNALTTRYWYDPIFGKKVQKKFEMINNVKIYRLSCNQIYSSFCFLLVKFLSSVLPSGLLAQIKLQSAGPYLLGLFQLLKAQQFDVIHFSPSPLALNMQVITTVSQLQKKPKLLFTPFFHSHISDFSNPQLKKIFDAAANIHTISTAEKNDISQRFSIHKNKITIIPLFLDTTFMSTENQLKKSVIHFKNTYHLNKRKIILLAGIKGAAKGAVDTLLAVNSLYKKYPEYILVAIGTNTLEWEQAKKIVDQNCLLDFSYKTGKRKEVLFSACDIFCMPSNSESFGLVYLEAWHKKKPVIAADTKAVKEFLGKDGLFVEYGNKAQIIQTILSLDKKKTVAQRLGESGYKKLMNTYTFKKVFPKYIKLFSKS